MTIIWNWSWPAFFLALVALVVATWCAYKEGYDRGRRRRH